MTGAPAGSGHNGGPTLEPGAGWRRYAWRRARAELLPTLPLEVVRLRVQRARELGIDYKAYASVRAATGRDVIALLFSVNALRITPAAPAMPPEEAARLAAVSGAERQLAVYRPLAPDRALAVNAAALDMAAPAPVLAEGWAATRERLAAFTRARGLPSDAVLVIGATTLEAEWVAAGRMAGYLPVERYFPAV